MKVSQLARTLNIAPDTVRYYTRIEFIKPRINDFNGYKEYSQNDLNRLRFIMSARHQGFTVKDIGKILKVSDSGQSGCPLVRDLIAQRLEETEQQFTQTLALRNRMRKAIELWESKPNREPTGEMICHLIEEFSEHFLEEN